MCTSENYGMDLAVDINTQLYPMNIGDRFTLALTRSLREVCAKIANTAAGAGSSAILG